MYYNIILLLTLSCFWTGSCNLNKEEGAACEWQGIKGTCVESHKCLTTLDEKSPKQPVCSVKGAETIICCTDCELVNDTRNAVLSPTSGIYWKTGQKAWDKCLEYLEDLPNECRKTSYGGMTRELDEAKKCHEYSLYAIGGSPSRGAERAVKYPHLVLLGYGQELENARWLCGGSIISEKYVLTVAHCVSNLSAPLPSYVAYEILNQGTSSQTSQHVYIKRIIEHPDYEAPKKCNDIALIEVDTPITFNKNVLPACLHVSLDAYDDEVEAPMWTTPGVKPPPLKNYVVSANTMKKFSPEECSKQYPIQRLLPEGIDANSQVCYGSADRLTYSHLGGEPLVIKSQISSCVNTVVGLSAFGRSLKREHDSDVYTKVSHFVPWIESIVWP